MPTENGGNGPLQTTVADAARFEGGMDLNQLGALLAASEDRPPAPPTAETRPNPPPAAGDTPEETALSQNADDIPPTDADPGSEAEESPTEPEAETETEPDEIPAHVQERIDRRIGKEVGKRKEAETKLKDTLAQLETLQSRLAELEERPEPEAKVLLAEDIDPLRSNPAIKPLRDREQAVQQVIDQLTLVRKRLSHDPDAVLAELRSKGVIQDPSMDAETLREKIVDLIDDKRVDLSATRSERSQTERQLKQALAQQEAQWTATAKQEFPWFGNKTDPRSAIADQIMREFPMLKAVPFWPMFAHAGANFIHAAQQAKSAPKAPAKPAAVAPAKPLRQPGVRPSSAPASQRSAPGEAEWQAFEKDPSSSEAKLRLAAALMGQK